MRVFCVVSDALHCSDTLLFFSDMTLQSEVFNNSIALFAAKSQDVRAAAAFAAGEKQNKFLFSSLSESFTS